MTDVLCCNERGILCLCSVCVVVRVFKQGSEIWMDGCKAHFKNKVRKKNEGEEDKVNEARSIQNQSTID